MSSSGLRGAGIVGVPGVSISATTSSVGVCRTGTSSGVAIVSEVATANSSGDTVPPPGSCRSSSSSTSATAFSATGFLLAFLIRPIYTLMPKRCSVGSSTRAMHPGAGSTRTTADGPSMGRSSMQRRARLSRRTW